MERLVMLSPKADPTSFKGQRSVVVERLRKLGAARRPVPLVQLLQSVPKKQASAGAVKGHLRALERAKLARIHRTYGPRADVLYAVNPARINERLKTALVGKRQSHGLVVLRYLLAHSKPATAADIIAGVKATRQYKTDGKPDGLILGDLRILHRAGVVRTHRAMVLPPKKPVSSTGPRVVKRAA